MSTLKIQVGASLDRSTMQVFRALADTAKRARTEIDNAERKSASEQERRMRQLGREAERWARQEAAERKRYIRETEQAAKKAAAETEAAHARASRKAIADLREQQHEQRKLNELQARGSTRIARERAELRGSVYGAMGMGARGAIGLGGRAMRFAAGVGMDYAHAIGVDTSLASYMGKNAALETAAVQLSNAAYMPGARGAAGERQDPQALMREAFAVGGRTGIGANEIMTGMQNWTSITGDLETGRAVVERLATLSKATGANFDDMASAAANAANALGDMPDKAVVVDRIMRSVAGQGKLGAVEIKDLASQMAKVAASAGLIAGDRAANVTMLAAIAQEARAGGGAPSAQGAATAVGSLMNTFSKRARLEAFKKYGVKTQEDSGLLRSPQSIIVDALRASVSGGRGVAGSNLAMGEMFMDAKARQATKGFEKIFLSAYQGHAGDEQGKLAAATRAVNEEFERLQKAQIEEEELRESFSRAMGTSQSQAEQFNNAIQQSVLQMQQELTPALKTLAPEMIKLAGSAANAVTNLLHLGKPAEEVAKGEKDIDKILAAENRAIAQGAGGKVDEALVARGEKAAKDQRKRVDELRATAAGRREEAGSYTGKFVGAVGGLYEAATGTGRWSDKSGWARLWGVTGGAAQTADHGAGEHTRNLTNVAEAEEKQADEAAGKLDLLNKTNGEIRDLLSRGILVKMENTGKPLPGAKPPAASNMPPGEGEGGF